MSGALAGLRRSVPRGELRVLVLAVWATTGTIAYASDCEAAVKGRFGPVCEVPHEMTMAISGRCLAN
eukprot:3896050-Pyramimonas_sp.AAC.1